MSDVFQQTLAGKRRRTTDKCEVEAGCGKDGVSGKNVENDGKRTISAWDVDELLVLFRYPSGSGRALLNGILPLRYCSARFACLTPSWRLPALGSVRSLVAAYSGGGPLVAVDEVGRDVCWVSGSGPGRKRIRLIRKTPAHLAGYVTHSRPKVWKRLRLAVVFTLVGLLWSCARFRGSCHLTGPRVLSCGFGRLWHCATALVWFLVQLPVWFPCALCGVLRGLLGSSGAHLPGWLGGPLIWRSAHTVVGPAAPGPHPLAHRCGVCWWCHDEAHRAQHHRPWGVEFRRPCQAAFPVGVLSCRRALLPVFALCARPVFSTFA